MDHIPLTHRIFALTQTLFDLLFLTLSPLCHSSPPFLSFSPLFFSSLSLSAAQGTFGPSGACVRCEIGKYKPSSGGGRYTRQHRLFADFKSALPIRIRLVP